MADGVSKDARRAALVLQGFTTLLGHAEPDIRVVDDVDAWWSVLELVYPSPLTPGRVVWVRVNSTGMVTLAGERARPLRRSGGDV